MDDDRVPWFGVMLLLIVVAIIVGFGGYMNGYIRGKNEMLLDGVKHGVAIWVTDDDGTAHIEWRKK